MNYNVFIELDIQESESLVKLLLIRKAQKSI
jgi:hypothetical protein